MVRIPLSEMLNSLLGRKPVASSQPAIQPAQAAVPNNRAPMFAQEKPRPASPVSHRPKTGLRPASMPQHLLDQFSRNVELYEFHLEAVWLNASACTIEVLCWEHYNGDLEPLVAFTGDPKQDMRSQYRSVQLDNRGHYALLQLTHNESIGTWWRRLHISRTGMRQHLKAVTDWKKAWQDALPEGILETQGLVTSVALTVMEFPHRSETDVQWAARRMLTNQRANKSVVRGVTPAAPAQRSHEVGRQPNRQVKSHYQVH